MKKISALGLILSAQLGAFAQTATLGITADMALSFQAKSNAVKGFAKKEGTGYTAKNVTLAVNTLKTGLGPRDSHLWLHLVHPTFTLTEAKTTSPKDFQGTLKLGDKTQAIKGTYSVKGTTLTALFDATISGFGLPPATKAGIDVEDTVKVSVTLPVK